MEAKLQKLEDDRSELMSQLKGTQDRLSATLLRVDEKIAEMQRALDGLDKAARRSDADTGIQLQKTIEDLAMLRGQVETYQFRISELEAALKKSSEDTDKRLTEMQGSEAAKAAEARKRADEVKRPTDKREFLSLADERAKSGEVPLARILYGEFLKKWPRDELTGEAHFGLGETYFNESKCREALFEYGKVVQEFTKSRSASTAYLRSSDCFRKLKMYDESKLALEELLRQFPASAAAKVAKGKLVELEKERKKSAPAPGPAKGKK